MNLKQLLAPVLLLTTLSVATAADDAGAPVAAASSDSEATISTTPAVAAAPVAPGASCAEAAGTPSAAAPAGHWVSGIDATPAPFAWHGGPDQASLKEARAKLEAKISELRERDLLTAEAAEELRNLLDDIGEKLASHSIVAGGEWAIFAPLHGAHAAPAAGCWVIPGLAGDAAALDWHSAPLALELEALHGFDGICPLTGKEAEAAHELLFVPGHEAHDGHHRIRIEENDGEWQVDGEGLSEEQLAEVKKELEAAQSGAARLGEDEHHVLMLELERANAAGLAPEVAAKLAEELAAASVAFAPQVLAELELELAELPELDQLQLELEQLNLAKELGGLHTLQIDGAALAELQHKAPSPLSAEQLAEIHSAMSGLASAELSGVNLELAALLKAAQQLATGDEARSERLSALLEEFVDNCGEE